jgi:membrane protein implicated in regulation of membrane protease activity
MTRVLPAIRLAAFILFFVGLLLRLVDMPWHTETLLVAAGLMMAALLGHLFNGGWSNSHPDEKVRLGGHLLLLYGFSTMLTWLWQLPWGWPAIGSGACLLALATWLRYRRQREDHGPESRIDEIGRRD